MHKKAKEISGVIILIVVGIVVAFGWVSHTKEDTLPEATKINRES